MQKELEEKIMEIRRDLRDVCDSGGNRSDVAHKLRERRDKLIEFYEAMYGSYYMDSEIN